MASNTSRLDLLKKNPVTDGADTFNIDTMLNENWDKIDKRTALIDPLTGKLLPGQVDIDTSGLATKQELQVVKDDATTHKAERASLTEVGHVQLSDATNSTSTTLAATPSAVRQAYDLAYGKQGALPVENRRKITFGTAEPTGGVDGDIYFQYE